MPIEIKKGRLEYFSAIFPLALKSVVPVGTAASMTRSIQGLDGYVLSGFGHEVQALLLLDCISGIAASLSGEELEVLVLRSLIGCKIDQQPNKDGFLRRLRSEIEAYTRTQEKPYHCAFFLQASNLPEWVTSTTILGHRLRRAPRVAWTAMSRALPEMCDRVGIEEFRLAGMQAVEVNVRARKSIEGIDIADQISRVLRGAYMLNRGGSWTIAERTPTSKNPFRQSPLYSLREGRMLVEWATVPNFEFGRVDLHDVCPPKTKLVLNALSKVPEEGSVQEVIRRALVLYAAAGDAPLGHDRFLGLWQSIEALSLVDQGDTRQIAQNVGNLWRNESKVTYYQLLALAPFRNKLVHVGEYDAQRQSAAFLLEEIARDAIVQFTQLSKRLKTKEHFREFMSMMALSDERMKVRDEAMRMVGAIRKPSEANLSSKRTK